MEQDGEKSMNLNAQRLAESWQEFLATTGGIGRPRSEADYLDLLRLLDELTDHYRISDRRLEPLFDLLIGYVGEWERENEPAIPDVPPGELLSFFLDQHDLSKADLEREGVANRTLVSKVINGKREISKALAKRLADRFGTDPSVFL